MQIFWKYTKKSNGFKCFLIVKKNGYKYGFKIFYLFAIFKAFKIA